MTENGWLAQLEDSRARIGESYVRLEEKADKILDRLKQMSPEELQALKDRIRRKAA